LLKGLQAAWEKWALRGILLLSLVHGLAYAYLVPPWQAPDEPGHFEHSYLLASQWRLLESVRPDPKLEKEIISSLYANRYWEYLPHPQPQEMPERLAELGTFAGRSRTLTRPSLSYLPYALALWPLRHQDADFQVRLLRSLSAFYIPVVVWLTWRSARLLFPSDAGIAVIASAFVALLPEHAHIMASVSDGNLTEVLSALFFLLAARAAEYGLTFRRGVAFGLTCLLALLCKNTALFLIPSLLVALILLGFRGRVSLVQAVSGVAAAAALAMAGARFAPRSAHVRRLLRGWQVLVQAESYTPDRLHHYQRWIGMTFESFWGRFGWMNIRMKDEVYLLLVAFCVLVLTGVVVRGRVFPERVSSSSRRCLWLYAVSSMLSLVFVLGTFVVYYSPSGNFSQGRYLFPALLPIAVITAYGCGASVLRASGRYVMGSVLAGLVALAAYALFGTVLGTFHG